MPLRDPLECDQVIRIWRWMVIQPYSNDITEACGYKHYVRALEPIQVVCGFDNVGSVKSSVDSTSVSIETIVDSVHVGLPLLTLASVLPFVLY